MRPITLVLTLAASALVAQACIAESNFAEKFAEAGCDQEKRCWDDSYGEFDGKACRENAKETFEMLLDECADYDGRLAYKCLQDVEDQKCDEYEETKACREFNKSCGFDTGQALAEYEGGMAIYGFGDIRWSAPE
jgi:hypothetical protein